MTDLEQRQPEPSLLGFAQLRKVLWLSGANLKHNSSLTDNQNVSMPIQLLQTLTWRK